MEAKELVEKWSLISKNMNISKKTDVKLLTLTQSSFVANTFEEERLDEMLGFALFSSILDICSENEECLDTFEFFFNNSMDRDKSKYNDFYMRATENRDTKKLELRYCVNRVAQKYIDSNKNEDFVLELCVMINILEIDKTCLVKKCNELFKAHDKGELVIHNLLEGWL